MEKVELRHNFKAAKTLKEAANHKAQKAFWEGYITGLTYYHKRGEQTTFPPPVSCDAEPSKKERILGLQAGLKGLNIFSALEYRAYVVMDWRDGSVKSTRKTVTVRENAKKDG